jgi:putative hydrolase of HD superfamily
MAHLNQLRYFYHLKSVERHNSQGKRKESSAEHSWSGLVLADYFLGKVKQKLDKIKVYEMLLYHDLVEIEVGDVNITDGDKRKGKKELELKAMQVVKQKIPIEMGNKFVRLFQEFEDGNTPEAKFCKAIDALDAVIHELDYKHDWKGWTEDFLREKKSSLFEPFPEMKEFFEEVLTQVRKEGYFSQTSQKTVFV